MFVHRNEQGREAVTLDEAGADLPKNLGPWSKIGPASDVSYEETRIIDKDGYCLRE